MPGPDGEDGRPVRILFIWHVYQLISFNVIKNATSKETTGKIGTGENYKSLLSQICSIERNHVVKLRLFS